MKRPVSTAIILLFAAGCLDKELPTPAVSLANPRFQLSATARGAPSGSFVTAVLSYSRSTGGRVRLGEATVTIDGGTTQVPVNARIGSCLGDPDREGPRDSCPIRLIVALYAPTGGEAIDSVEIGPFAAGAEQSPQIPPIALTADRTMVITPSTTSVAAGSSEQFAAIVRDGSGATLDGRPVRWTSSNPGVLAVSATGVGSGVTFGSAMVSARHGSLVANASVVVGPPCPNVAAAMPAAMSMNSATSTASGRDLNNSTFSFRLDPRGAFLSTENDSSLPPLVVPLGDIGAKPGDWLTFDSFGTFTFWVDEPGWDGIERGSSLIAIFSRTDVLLPRSSPNRVPEPVHAFLASGGIAPNLQQSDGWSTPNDIPLDFSARHVTVRIPPMARYVFVGVPDRYYADNRDSDGDFGVRLTLVSCVPAK